MQSRVEREIEAVARIDCLPSILKLVSEVTGLGVALVARVSEGAWTACAVRDTIEFGLSVGDSFEPPAGEAKEPRAPRPVVFDAESAKRLAGVERLSAVRCYVAVPIVSASGEHFGDLCAFDVHETELRSRASLPLMEMLARLIALELERGNAAARADDRLSVPDLREQFLAVLAHDLRNPLGSISMGVSGLLTLRLPDPAQALLERVQSSTRRIELLIADLLDLARGRFGGGLPVQPAALDDLDSRLRHVVREVASTCPERVVEVRTTLSGTIVCDPRRVEQALSNLLSNALDHGGALQPVQVELSGGPHEVVLSVRNFGNPIPETTLPRIFQPFFRGAECASTRGLGLGLFIVAEIARAHGGRVEARSSRDEGTLFTLTLPRVATIHAKPNVFTNLL